MSKNSISSGAEQALHSGQLAVKHSLILALVFVIFGAISLGGATYLITSPKQQHAFAYQIGIAEIGGIVNNREKAAMDRQISPDLDAFWQAVKKSLPMGAIGGGVAVWALLWMFKNLGDSTKGNLEKHLYSMPKVEFKPALPKSYLFISNQPLVGGRFHAL